MPEPTRPAHQQGRHQWADFDKKRERLHRRNHRFGAKHHQRAPGVEGHYRAQRKTGRENQQQGLHTDLQHLENDLVRLKRRLQEIP